MDPIEIKKTEVELLKVRAARADIEYMILQRETDIARLQANIQIQLDKETELEERLKLLKGA